MPTAHPNPPENDQRISLAAQRLREGRVVAFPTETVYGLGADALNAAAVARVFALKGRPSNNPLIVHVLDAAMAKTLTAEWPARAHKLAHAFWPGPLTIVLPRNDRLPSAVTASGNTVALRSPDHALARALLASFGGPLVGPSANKSGRVSPTTAAHIKGVWSEDDVMILDGGPCRVGIESTVLSLADGPAKILRPGLISAHEISAILNEPIEQPQPLAANSAPNTAPTTRPLPSPGLLAQHYAPRTPARLFSPQAALKFAPQARIVLITHIMPPPDLITRFVSVFALPDDPVGYASAIYRALREADALAPDMIAINPPPHPQDSSAGPWLAIADRLTRATAPAPKPS